MIIWALNLVLDILFNIICWVTNPIVCLFADEYGELPKCLRYWQTYDNTLDIEWMISEYHVPKFAEYDFNKHYHYIDEWKAEEITGKHKGYVELLDPNFTLKEKFQRYVCRLCWMYRNCGYGFSYEITGKDIDGSKVIEEVNDHTKGHRVYWGHYDKWLTTEPFCYYAMIRWNPKDISWLKWTNVNIPFTCKIFFGWKFQDIKLNENRKCMLAFFLWPFK
ncbi:MAG: hypothetical protein IJ193_07940 [Bacilli bacterium]|nr:hypothetical protein [Bacilli bacterium]